MITGPGPAHYDAEKLRSVLAELEAGRRFATAVRGRRGRIRSRDIMTLKATFRVEAPEAEPSTGPLSAAMTAREVGHLVIRVRRDRRETFDANDVRLAAAARSALGRMLLQAETGTVGPIMLKEFTTALAAFDQRRRTRT